MDDNLKRALLEFRFDLERFQSFACGYSNKYLIDISYKLLKKIDLIINEQYNYKKSNIIDFNKIKKR